MIKHNQDGAANGLVISLVLAVIFLIGALAFGGWAFNSMQNYKNNTDQIAAQRVDTAKKEQSIELNKQFAEQEKSPLKAYVGPDAFGTLHIDYPKTWSGYVSQNGGTQYDAYFAPGVVPTTTDTNSVFSLRVQVSQTSYADSMQNFNSQVSNGVHVSAYSLPKLPKVVGAEVTGKVDGNTNVTMIVLPLRSQTLKIWTEGDQYLSDFNNIILPHFTFSP